ncbi:MAG: hypothetical protein QOH62_23 [Solirubrobacteraceae bacterium]|jgi:hypothetical protein|nr:hypothetical protein [Solirubrobacteraceae bacterium]
MSREKPRLAGLWFAVPILTWGMFAWAPFLYVALRARARAWTLAAIAYLAAVITLLPLDFVHPERVQAPHAGFFLHWGLALVATVHLGLISGAFTGRLAIFEHPERETAERRLLARQEARRLIAADPIGAREMNVGRPDLGTTFDGGLVDINHVSAEVLAQLPDMSRDVAVKIAHIRDELGGFESLDDFDQVVDLPVRTLDQWRPIAVFLP